MRKIVLLLLLLLSLPVFADDWYCYRCEPVPASPTPQCVRRYEWSDGLYGYTACSSGWTDCHDGTLGPCEPHCHFNDEMCDVSDCTDANNNNICDNDETGGLPGPPSLEVCNSANCSPLVVNLGSGPWQFSGESDPVSFDLTGDGQPEWITWTARGSDVAFLAVDRNGDGVINDGSELFGSYAPEAVLGDRSGINGFTYLAQSDTNGDGNIDSADAIWPRLLFWVDADHDGISAPAELRPVSASAIQSFDLQYVTTKRVDRHGNSFRFMGFLKYADGRRARYFDVFFRAVQ